MQGDSGGREGPIIRRAHRHPHADAPDGADAAWASDRLDSLTHELANLLDGAMRCLRTAMRSWSDPTLGGPGGAMQRLQAVHSALDRMADAVRAATPAGAAGVLDRRSRRVSPSLAEAVEHAAEVMRPLAEEHGIGIVSSACAEAWQLRAGPAYPLVAAAVRNSIEAITSLPLNESSSQSHSGSPSGGTPPRPASGPAQPHAPAAPHSIRIAVWLRGQGAQELVCIEVVDTGPGPSAEARHEPSAVFRPGFTTKPGGRGIGLALAHDLVHELGGTLTLAQGGGPPDRPGAVLLAVIPADRLAPVIGF